MLARAADRLAHQASAVSDAFLELLDTQSCGGQRCALTSETLHREEQNLSRPDCWLVQYAAISSDALVGQLQVWSDNQPHAFGAIPVDDRDKTLLAVTQRAATTGHDVVLLTDDMRLYQWAFDLALDDSFAAWTLLSIVFLGELARCGALNVDDVATIADIEQEHLDFRHIPPELYKAKLEKIVFVINNLAWM